MADKKKEPFMDTVKRMAKDDPGFSAPEPYVSPSCDVCGMATHFQHVPSEYRKDAEGKERHWYDHAKIEIRPLGTHKHCAIIRALVEQARLNGQDVEQIRRTLEPVVFEHNRRFNSLPQRVRRWVRIKGFKKTHRLRCWLRMKLHDIAEVL